MGLLESGSIYLHPMCWDPQEPGGTHIQSEVSQPGPMDLRTNPGSCSCSLVHTHRPRSPFYLMNIKAVTLQAHYCQVLFVCNVRRLITAHL